MRRKKREIILLIVLVLSTISMLSSQFSSIYGKVTYIESKQLVDSIKIELYDQKGMLLQTTFSSQGMYTFNNLAKGEYYIEHTTYVYSLAKITNITLDSNENLELNLEVKDPCKSDQSNGVCPICKSKKNVLRIEPLLMVSSNFGKNEKAFNRIWEKNQKKGYATSKLSNGEQVVFEMYIEKEQSKFYDLCNKWFCTRTKNVF